MLGVIRIFFISLSFVTALAFAADPSAESEDETFTISSATCADIYDLFTDATPGEDKDPTSVERAQDDVLYFVIWVHGYLSGRDGINPEKRPLSKEGIKKTIADIDAVCEPDESKAFLDVVNKIQ